MHQNVGKEKRKSTFSGFLTKIANVPVMNFIPVKVSTLYTGVGRQKFVPVVNLNNDNPYSFI
jgi:hypothetical protein